MKDFMHKYQFMLRARNGRFGVDVPSRRDIVRNVSTQTAFHEEDGVKVVDGFNWYGNQRYRVFVFLEGLKQDGDDPREFYRVVFCANNQRVIRKLVSKCLEDNAIASDPTKSKPRALYVKHGEDGDKTNLRMNAAFEEVLDRKTAFQSYDGSGYRMHVIA